MSLLRITAGIISQPASGSPPRPPRPTGPSLRAGYSVPLISATTARSARERHGSPAAEDFYPSSPAEGHPPRESDIATRRPGADTVTGLSPVGALPLQAARFGEGHDENHFGIAAGRIGQHVRAARDARRRGVHAPIEGRQR